MDRNILPTYSPTIPMVNISIPEKKNIATIVEAQPTAMDGCISFLMNTTSAPMIPRNEIRKYTPIGERAK